MIILGIIGLLFIFYLLKDILTPLFWGCLIAVFVIIIIKKISKCFKEKNNENTNNIVYIDENGKWICPKCYHLNNGGQTCIICRYKVKSIKYSEQHSKLTDSNVTKISTLSEQDTTKKTYYSVSTIDYPLCDAFKDALNKKFIAFDVETTGLNPRNDRIVEIGAVLFENRKPTKKFATLVNPKIKISPEATAINKITNDMLLDAPCEETVYSDLIDFLGDAFADDFHGVKTFICAHNAKFDISFLSETLKRLGYNGSIKYVDTLSPARSLISDIKNYKQPTIANYFGIVNEQEHRAVSDAETCGYILLKLLDLQQEIKEKQQQKAEREQEEKRQREKELEKIRKEYNNKRNEVTINPVHNRVPLSDISNLYDWEKGYEAGYSYWENGDFLRKGGNIEAAIELFDKARYNGYNAPAIYNSYAMAYRQLKDYDNEIDILDEAIARYNNETYICQKFEARRYRAVCLLIAKNEKQLKSIRSPKNKIEVSNVPKKPIGRAILQLSDDMSVIKKYESVSKASTETGVNPKSIRDAAKGVQKHAGGFIWKYADENNNFDENIPAP